ncbi:MAG: dTDP-4-dehydrorhamnose reductase [Burkholderiales bacterium]
MKILVIGGSGQVGSELVRQAPPAHATFAPPSSALDLADAPAVAAQLAETGAQVVVNCAAYHRVVDCETHAEEAFRINCVAIRDLARACRARGAKLVSLSSDYVFDGARAEPYREDDCPRPIQVYGITRRAGECAALAEYPEGTAVVRTSAVFGTAYSRSRDGNFISKCVAAARKTGRLEVAVENTFSPTYAGDLAAALLRLIGLPGFFPGVYHLTNEGACSWFELAGYAVRALKIDCHLTPVDRGSRTGDMLRPRQSVLANTRAAALGVRLPAWQDAVSRYVEQARL